jgi:hypothetical protein
MDKNRFNAEVRPQVTVIPIGKQGIGFDRSDLKAWLKKYKHCHGIRSTKKGESAQQWQKKSALVYENEAEFGISKNKSLEFAFEKALILSARRKHNVTWPIESKC